MISSLILFTGWKGVRQERASQLKVWDHDVEVKAEASKKGQVSPASFPSARHPGSAKPFCPPRLSRRMAAFGS
jgi:hypothetical protein